jgi:SAM-dependent methyltransferase
MTEHSAKSSSARPPLHGLRQIVRYNWPRYAIGLIAIAATLATIWLTAPPLWLRCLLLVGVALAAWWILASLVASYWIYDYSPLTRWEWVAQFLPPSAARGRLLNIHAGFDESTVPLQTVFPAAQIAVVDLFDPELTTEPSIRRARLAAPALPGTVAATPNRLPFPDASQDGIFMLLAAHELRRPADREALFAEAARLLAPDGRIVLTEHARDAANFAAFGPGFMHFLPYEEWHRVSAIDGLRIKHESRITPFIRVLVLQR